MSPRVKAPARGAVSAPRRAVIAAVATALVTGSGTVSAQPRPTAYDLVSRPDLHPPAIDVRTPATGTEPGNIFLTPAPAVAIGGGPEPKAPVQPGPMVADDAGQPVWFAPPAQGVAANLQPQQYQGKPVLTWWQGTPIFPPGYGQGEFQIVDDQYHPVATVRAGNGLQADLHEFVITPQNTALLVAYQPVKRDLTAIGGPKDATVLQNVVQEVDIASGNVLFQWNSLDHIGEDESMVAPPQDPNAPYDYLHLNSISLDGGGNLLISARNTHALYQVNRSNGAINWRMNGKKSDFRMGRDAGFAWQHDARRLPDGSISMFDNGAAPPVEERSRALTLRVDENARTADVARAHTSPEGLLSPHQGNNQALANGHEFVGWGGQPFFSEFGPQGEVLYHAQFEQGVTSYRAFRASWVGRPTDPPAVGARFANDAGTSVYASWNGATEVRGWRVLAGPDPDHLRPVQDAGRTGFETKVDVGVHENSVEVQALDVNGGVLGTSPAVQPAG